MLLAADSRTRSPFCVTRCVTAPRNSTCFGRLHAIATQQHPTTKNGDNIVTADAIAVYTNGDRIEPSDAVAVCRVGLVGVEPTTSRLSADPQGIGGAWVD